MSRNVTKCNEMKIPTLWNATKVLQNETECGCFIHEVLRNAEAEITEYYETILKLIDSVTFRLLLIYILLHSGNYFTSIKDRDRGHLNYGDVPNNCRGHQTSPTVVSLKSRLPQEMQSKSTLSCEIVQIHSLFRHGFIKKPKSKFNRNRK